VGDATATGQPGPDEGTGPEPSLAVQLRVTGRRCVVVGGGGVGTRRARALAAAGADVLVVAPEVHPALRELVDSGSVRLRAGEFDEGDLAGALLVVAATGVRAVDERVGAAAGAAGVPVNRADDAARGDLAFPAVVRRGPVSVAVSTGGRAPAAARWLAERLDGGMDALTGLGPQGYGLLVEIVEEVRQELRAEHAGGRGVTPEAPDWRTALDGTILELMNQGRRAEAKERLLACLSSS
jgi:siroheme synthase-like protein